VSSDAGTAVPEGFVRPEPPEPPEVDTRWASIADDPGEWALSDPGRRCRWRGSGAGTACGDAAVLRRVRGIVRRIPWHYCGTHGYDEYGRWAENGKVMHWELRDD
jgi:hypothetical protein